MTRFFPRDRWTPFQALLWQAICQSRDILFLGLGTAVAFGLWQVFFSEQFFAIMNEVDEGLTDWRWCMRILGLGIIAVAFLIAFGLGSSIFAQDQERGMYRVLGQRGVSARLVWWSRILPFFAVFLVPVPFIVMMFDTLIQDPQRSPGALIGMAFVVFMYFAPFCFGTFYSLLFRNVLVSMLMTFGTWLLYMFGMSLGGQVCMQEFGIEPHPAYFSIPIVVTLFFPLASRLMTTPWLREEPWRRRWLVPTLTLAVFAVYAFGPTALYFCSELIRYLFPSAIIC